MNRRVKRQQKDLEKVFSLLGIRQARWWAAAAIVLILAAGQALNGLGDADLGGSGSQTDRAGASEASKKGSHYTGRVVKVADGDTVTVIDSNGAKHKIRLLGIDAPETKQAHGQASGQWLNGRVMDRTIAVEVQDVDRYGREVAKLIGPSADCKRSDCPLSTDINLESLSLGHSWWYRAYAKDQPAGDRPLYESAEQTARSQRLGLWGRPEPLAPWEWRKQQRGN